MSAPGQVRVGISGWTYPGWRGDFYPPGLVQRRELAYAAERLTSIEVNGSFYSLQRPTSYTSWREATPDDFVFSVKGPRFVTHLKRLVGVETALANFFASGLLGLGPKLGPVLWQLPPRLTFDEARLDTFLTQLPRTTVQAAELARRHDARLEGRTWLEVDAEREVRHALEIRDESFRDPAFLRLLERHGVAFVVADTAGRWPLLFEATARLVYVRLHGDVELYTSGYSAEALDGWAALVRAWRAGESPLGEHTVGPPAVRTPREVFVYFDNDVKVCAPFDAIALAERVD